MHSLFSNVSRTITNYISRLAWTSQTNNSHVIDQATPLSSHHITEDGTNENTAHSLDDCHSTTTIIKNEGKMEISDSEHSQSCNDQGNNNIGPETTEFETENNLLDLLQQHNYEMIDDDGDMSDTNNSDDSLASSGNKHDANKLQTDTNSKGISTIEEEDNSNDKSDDVNYEELFKKRKYCWNRNKYTKLYYYVKFREQSGQLGRFVWPANTTKSEQITLRRMAKDHDLFINDQNKLCSRRHKFYKKDKKTHEYVPTLYAGYLCSFLV